MATLELAPDVRAQLDAFEVKLETLEKALLPLRDATPAQVDASCPDPLDRARAHLALARATEALSGAGLALRGAAFEADDAAEAQRERLNVLETRLEGAEKQKRQGAEADEDAAGRTRGSKTKRGSKRRGGSNRRP